MILDLRKKFGLAGHVFFLFRALVYSKFCWKPCYLVELLFSFIIILYREMEAQCIGARAKALFGMFVEIPHHLVVFSITTALKSILKLVKLQSLVAKRCKMWKM